VKKLFVLYDARCDFCQRCRRWLDGQVKFVDLVFVPAASEAARRRFPKLRNVGRVDELVVVSDTGGVYRGARAWVMCLWALHEYRGWSEVLASPAVMPLARKAFAALSANRRRLSWLLGPSEEGLWEELRRSAGEEFAFAAARPRPADGDVRIIEELPPEKPGCRSGLCTTSDGNA
jgi:predicted DCC family thiol-disulfide oxidoreductase YuxK